MGPVTAVVDFGTSHTVAVVSGPGLPARLVTVDGHPWFPSAVFWTGRGEAVVGTDALRLARTEPARLERDCTPDYELRGQDVQQVCHLFAVPTGTPVRDAEISMYGTDSTLWRLS